MDSLQDHQSSLEKSPIEFNQAWYLAQKMAKVGIWFWDMNSDCLQWNENMFSLFGLDPQKDCATFDNWNKALYPKDVKKAHDTLNQAIKEHTFLNNQYRVKKNGRIVWIEALGQAEYSKDGKPIRMTGVCFDITKRKEAEDNLRRSEEEKTNYLESMTDGFVAFNKEWRYTYVNSNAAKILHKSKEELIGKLGIEVFPSASKFLSQFQKAVSTGRPVHFEEYYPDLNIWYGCHCYPSKEGLTVFFSDITERKKAEEALKQVQSKLQEYANNLEKLVEERSKQVDIERKRFFSILDNLPVMVCLITADYKIPFANRLFREKFGEAKGRCCYEYVGCVEAPCSECQSLIPLQTGKPHHWIANFPDGTVIDAHDFPFTDVDGTKMVIEADVEITERVILQKQLQKKERLAAIGATAGMVGHDIRNPLQAIIGDVYLLKDYLTMMPENPTKKDVAESLDEIEKNVGYINKIVADLQDYSRTLTPEYSNVNLYSLVTSIFKPIAVPDNVSPVIEVATELWLKTDTTLLTRILNNLIINAYQAMPHGGTLTLKAFKTESGVTISVDDTGVGIPEHVKPKLFTPMVTTKSKGQGLGLAVVKRLVEALDGRVSFESQEGKGTKFIIELPITQ